MQDTNSNAETAINVSESSTAGPEANTPKKARMNRAERRKLAKAQCRGNRKLKRQVQAIKFTTLFNGYLAQKRAEKYEAEMANVEAFVGVQDETN